jgi:hypothetical protein
MNSLRTVRDMVDGVKRLVAQASEVQIAGAQAVEETK